ncbi:FAD-dependent oxidoreductase [Embleya sp. NPDC059237]|uniref:FAD-dependent oxidoreductase n=1 Tax=Embleya sp. NPDC059237 TaxID=3346784 RepID=UPI0036BADDE3
MTTSRPTHPDRTDVLVVGGGIGGLGAAFALAREGLRVRVLEAAPEFGEVGAGLQLAPNCTRILHEYGLLDEAKRRGVVPEAMVMFDAVDAVELTRLDLRDLERHYGFPYIVIHRSDLHALLLDACRRAGVDLATDSRVVEYRDEGPRPAVVLADGRVEDADVVIAADGLHSVARDRFVGDAPVGSSYVAYRGAVPIDNVRDHRVHENAVVVYVGPRCHFVQYALRGGEMFNQVAVFESPKALAGRDDWGTPDELDEAFADTTEQVRAGIPLIWRDRWWRMFDREPIDTWVFDRIALLGDAAHPPLQYLAQGAIMALEDGWVLARHAARNRAADKTVDWTAALAGYQAVRPEHCRRVQRTARTWGELWHLDGLARAQRNTILRERDTYDYTFIDWLYGPTALDPDQEAPMFTPIPLDSPGSPVGTRPSNP